MSLRSTNSSISMVRVDSSATFSSSSLDTSTKVSVSTLYPLTMSSLATSSPVSASTLEYLIRWPVFRLSWLKEIFSDSEVAGYSATGQVTSERRRKPFQFARGAMDAVLQQDLAVRTQDERRTMVPTSGPHPSNDFFRSPAFGGLDICSCYVLLMGWPTDPRAGACRPENRWKSRRLWRRRR